MGDRLHVRSSHAACGVPSLLRASASVNVQLTVERLYVGPLMTALDMRGFSLTLLEVDDARLELLDAPTEVRPLGLNPMITP